MSTQTSRDLLVRLCAAIPLPYVNQVRYFGVLQHAAVVRSEGVLAHTFGVDLDCKECGGPMRWVYVAKTSRAAARLMSQLGYASVPPTPTVLTPLGQLAFGFRSGVSVTVACRQRVQGLPASARHK